MAAGGRRTKTFLSFLAARLLLSVEVVAGDPPSFENMSYIRSKRHPAAVQKKRLVLQYVTTPTCHVSRPRKHTPKNGAAPATSMYQINARR